METVIVDAGKSLHRKVALLAQERGITLEQFCVEAIKERLGLLPVDNLSKGLEREIYRLIDNASSATTNTILAIKTP